MDLVPNKTPAVLAAALGVLGAHRFYFKQYKLGMFYFLLFLFVPVLTLCVALVDATFLLITSPAEWTSKKKDSKKTDTRKRIYLYGLVPFIYFGTPIVPFMPADNYSDAQDSAFYLSYQLPTGKIPLFYRDEYNIRFYGLENLHPFDSQKYGRIFSSLVEKGSIQKDATVEPPMLSENALLKVHTKEYLRSLRQPIELIKILEIPVVAFLPWQLTHRHVLTPMRYATSGTLMAARAAWEKG